MLQIRKIKLLLSFALHDNRMWGGKNLTYKQYFRATTSCSIHFLCVERPPRHPSANIYPKLWEKQTRLELRCLFIIPQFGRPWELAVAH